jgi:hypothetical protein
LGFGIWDSGFGIRDRVLAAVPSQAANKSHAPRNLHTPNRFRFTCDYIKNARAAPLASSKI